MDTTATRKSTVTTILGLPMLAACLLGALGVIGPGCGKTTDHTATDGQTRRLVSVAPALTAIVVDLGAADELVGVTRHCALPAGPKTPPAIIGDFRPVPERVLAARPTHVLMAAYATQAHEREGLEALGLPVKTFDLVTLTDLSNTVRELGVLLGRQGQAEALNTALETAKTRLGACFGPHDGPRRPSYALIYGTEPGFVYTTGGGDHISELLDLTGATNALSSYPRTARIGLERVLEARPELILYVAPSEEIPDAGAAVASWARWAEVPAVKNGAVRVWPDDRLARNGTHLAGLIPDLCALVRTAVLSPGAEPSR